MKKVTSNFFYQTIYQLTLLILPIITIPIVSHALGTSGLGLFSYVTSISSYFVLFAGLGLTNYGIREIASVQKDKYKLSEKFWSLEFFNIVVAIIVVLTYLIFLYIVKFDIFFLISGITVIATIFDISWFYYGIEDFKQITLINMIVKLLSFLFIVLLISDYSDLKLYFLIQSISVLVSNFSLWFFIKNKVYFVKPNFKTITNHFKPALAYFVGKASITIYTTLNRTILGLLSTTVAVGLYTNSLQMTTMFIGLVGTLDSVLMPHMTGLISNKKQNEVIELMMITINAQLYITIPLMFGLIVVNEKLIPWFFGNEFSYLSYTVPALAPLIIIIPLGTSIVRQYLVPMNNVKKFNISVIVAAIVGVLSNLIFIPLLGIWGAIISTLLSELIVTGIRLNELLKTTQFKFKIKNIMIYICCSVVMFILVFLLTQNMNETIFTTLIQGFLGGGIYFFLTTILRQNPILKIFLKDI